MRPAPQLTTYIYHDHNLQQEVLISPTPQTFLFHNPFQIETYQPADQSDEVEETIGGRVYFTSSDQNGDFRVGDLFRIQQATGIATLNADAFDFLLYFLNKTVAPKFPQRVLLQ